MLLPKRKYLKTKRRWNSDKYRARKEEGKQAADGPEWRPLQCLLSRARPYWSGPEKVQLWLWVCFSHLNGLRFGFGFYFGFGIDFGSDINEPAVGRLVRYRANAYGRTGEGWGRKRSRGETTIVISDKRIWRFEIRQATPPTPVLLFVPFAHRKQPRDSKRPSNLGPRQNLDLGPLSWVQAQEHWAQLFKLSDAPTKKTANTAQFPK